MNFRGSKYILLIGIGVVTDLTAKEESREMMIRVSVIEAMVTDIVTAAHVIVTTDITGMIAVTDTVVLETDIIIHIQIENITDTALEALEKEERKVEVTQREVTHVLEERAARKR